MRSSLSLPAPALLSTDPWLSSRQDGGKTVKRVSTVRVQNSSGRCEFDVNYSDEFPSFVQFNGWLKKPGGLYLAAGGGLKIPADSVDPTQDGCARITGGCASVRFLREQLARRQSAGL